MTPYTTLYAGPEKTYQSISGSIFTHSESTDKICSTDTWHGSVNQESMSVQTLTDRTSYDGKGFSSFGTFLDKYISSDAPC